MTESVQELDIGVVWHPNETNAVLVSNDFGSLALAMLPRWDDKDQRSVVLCWSGVMFASAGAPNDEANSCHRLYGKGLEDVSWIGSVLDSALVASIESIVAPSAARTDSITHHVVLTKERVIEVVAQSLDVRRIEGRTDAAALTALDALFRRD